MSGPARAVVADIGATRARFAIADLSTLELSDCQSYLCRDFSSPRVLFSAYRREIGTAPDLAVLAVAGPVFANEVLMTNLGWHVSQDDVVQTLGVRKAVLVNDLEAAARSLPFLPKSATVTIRSGPARGPQPQAVVGPGTGLGVACLIPVAGGWWPVAGEGGHASFAARTAEDWELVQRAGAGRPHVSTEYFVSGGGLVRIYNALAGRSGAATRAAAAAEVVERASARSDPVAREAVKLFTMWLGRFAGDIALIYGSVGGVFIAGGVVPNLLPLFDAGLFLDAFADKGRMRDWLNHISVHIITDTNAGVRGAAVAAGMIAES